jgi:hypothetical protein
MKPASARGVRVVFAHLLDGDNVEMLELGGKLNLGTEPGGNGYSRSRLEQQ